MYLDKTYNTYLRYFPDKKLSTRSVVKWVSQSKMDYSHNGKSSL